MIILVVNAGSSTHKLALFNMKNEEMIEPLWTAILDWGQASLSLSIQTLNGKKIKRDGNPLSLEEGLNLLLESLWSGETKVIQGPNDIERIGHRVVHGGRHLQPTHITPQVKQEIRALIPLAPLHNPANLEGIELMEKFFPNIPQIAVFDTAFHAGMPDLAKIYPLPYEWFKKGIQRYGFHGISHHYCAYRAANLLNKDLKQLKIINCHLGNGSSLCAIKEGKSIDTTMGFTPLEGLMMGTRCGSIDPGILLYLLREQKETPGDLDRILNFESGLKGICGSSDMREIMQKKEDKFQLALQMYIYHLRAYIGSLFVHLEGIDVLSFTGGIGENAVLVREEVCRGLKLMGIEIDRKRNENCEPDQDIAVGDISTRVLVIHTREEWMIAKLCLMLEQT